THQLPFFTDHCFAPGIHGRHVHSQSQALDLAPSDREHGVGEHEAADDVRATGDTPQKNVFFDLLVNEVELLGQKRRSGGEDGFKMWQLGSAKPAILQGLQELGTSAKDVDPLATGDIHELSYRRV